MRYLRSGSTSFTPCLENLLISVAPLLHSLLFRSPGDPVLGCVIYNCRFVFKRHLSSACANGGAEEREKNEDVNTKDDRQGCQGRKGGREMGAGSKGMDRQLAPKKESVLYQPEHEMTDWASF